MSQTEIDRVLKKFPLKNKLISTERLSSILSVDKKTIEKWVDDGKLEALILPYGTGPSQTMRFSKEGVKKFLEEELYRRHL